MSGNARIPSDGVGIYIEHVVPKNLSDNLNWKQVVDARNVLHHGIWNEGIEAE